MSNSKIEQEVLELLIEQGGGLIKVSTLVKEIACQIGSIESALYQLAQTKIHLIYPKNGTRLFGDSIIYFQLPTICPSVSSLREVN
jgi:hypothetical protein